jgi:hypothetical protein
MLVGTWCHDIWSTLARRRRFLDGEWLRFRWRRFRHVIVVTVAVTIVIAILRPRPAVLLWRLVDHSHILEGTVD